MVAILFRLRSLTLGLLLASPASAQCLLGELVPTQPGERHGVAFAVEGSTVVCADLAYDAYFFDRTPAGWVETDRLPLGAPGLTPGTPALALNDRLAAVGLQNDSSWGVAAGSVSVLERGAAGWRLQTTLHASDIKDGDQFGWSLALQDRELVVGARHLGELFGDGKAAVYVFQRNPGGWAEVQKIPTPIPGADLDFGRCLVLDGDTLLVGAPSQVSSAGTVYVYARGPGGWVQTQVLQAPDALKRDQFGHDLDLWGDTLIVGAHGDDDQGYYSGSAYVFERSGGTWAFDQKLLAQPGGPSYSFGGTVALTEDRALIGAPSYDTAGGRAYLFGKLAGKWTQLEVLDPPVHQDYQGFGLALALAQDHAFVASPALDWATVGEGALYEYSLEASESPTACDPTPNSTGSPAWLTHFGCSSLQAGDLTFAAGPVPAGALGVLFFGATNVQAPLFDGELCIGGALQRIALDFADPNGALLFPVDLGSGPAAQLVPGVPWTFQAIYRDVAGGPAGLNLSDAVTLTFEP